MAGVIPNGGELLQLQTLLATQQMRLRAYKNDVFPNELSVSADFVQADFSGYGGPINITGQWTNFVTVGGKAQANCPLQEWTCDGAGVPSPVYGIYVVDNNGDLLYAERDPNAPVSMSLAGQKYQYLPVYKFFSYF